MDKTSLGDRMKGYENIERKYLTRKLPLIIRIDGKAFHSYTKGFEQPFYRPFRLAMALTMLNLCEAITGCKIGYTQSDEITLVLTDDDTLETQPWFGKNLQKIVSISAAMATYHFNKNVENICRSREEDVVPLRKAFETKIAIFDSRAFCVPRVEVLNCLEWRQQDAIRNAVESAGRTYFSRNKLFGKSCADIKEMLLEEKGIDFNQYPAWFRRGVCAIKKPVKIKTPEGLEIERMKFDLDFDIPRFHEDPNYVDDIIYHMEKKDE